MTFPDLQPYYKLLELPAEAQAADVDAAYLRLAQQRLRAGDKASLGALKQARAKLKAALLEQEHAAAASRPQTYAQADSGVGRLQRRLEDWGWEAQVGIKGRSLHVALQASQVPRPLLTGAKVYTLVAQQVGSEPDFRHLQHLHVYGLQAPRQPRWRRQMTMPAPSWTTADFDLFSCQNRISSVFIFPGLLLLGLLLSAWNLSRFLLWGITIWFHEFGHATIAWLSGQRAPRLDKLRVRPLLVCLHRFADSVWPTVLGRSAGATALAPGFGDRPPVPPVPHDLAPQRRYV